MSVFVLSSGLAPKALLDGLGRSMAMEVLEERSEVLTYRDTFDWRLFSAGLTLTTSQNGKKYRAVVAGSDRQVVAMDARKIPLFATDLPPGPVKDLLKSHAKHRRLLPRARVARKKTLIAIVNEDRKTVVRVSLREGVACPVHGRDEVPLLPRLEIHPLKGYRAEEKEVTKLLRKEYRLRREKRTELETLCDAIGQTPGDYDSSFRLKLDPGMAAAEAARRIHRRLLQTMLANREGVLRDWDPEFLHDFRVSVRRTRSALSQIKGVFPEAVSDHFAGEFRWLGTRTGPARDMDVYLFNIPSYKRALLPETRANLEPLVRLLQEKKRVEHRRLRGCLRSKRFARLVEEWGAFLDNPDTSGPAPPRARRSAREVASERIWKAFKKVLKKGRKISGGAPPEALHRLRIRCKNLRYLLTFFRSLYPPKALSPLMGELKRLQDHLGDFNDLQVQREALRRFSEEIMATGSGPPATLLAMGQLMGQLEGEQARVREAFDECSGHFSRPKNQKRFQDLFGAPSGPGRKPRA